MISQIYLPSTHKFFTTFVNDPPFSFEFYLGAVETYKVIQDKNNTFISLGGDPSNPLTYKFLENGYAEFNFKIFDINTYLDNLHAPFGVYELWIDGIKPYYYYHEKRSGTFFDTTICVKGEKNKTCKFKFRLSIQEAYSFTPRTNEYRYKGGEDTFYSYITAKFTPDEPIEEKKIDSIVITNDTKMKMNQRYIVKAPILKTLQLTIDEDCKIGDYFEIKNMGLGNFQINTGDNIDIVMDGRTTRLKNGYIRSKKMGDFLRLECMETSPKIIFSDIHNIGSFTII